MRSRMSGQDWVKGFSAVATSMLWFLVMLMHVPIGCAGFIIHYTLGELYAHYLWANKSCRACGSRRRRLVDKCILYDKYFICKKCGLTDFSESRRLTPRENLARMRGLF